MLLKHIPKISVYFLGVICSSGVLLGGISNSNADADNAVKAELAAIVKAEPQLVTVSKKSSDTSPTGLFKEARTNKVRYAAFDDDKADSPASHPRAGHEIEDAREALRALGHVTDLADLSTHLTNRSAGAETMPMLLMVSSTYGALQKAKNRPDLTPDMASKLKILNERMVRVAALLKKYGMDLKAPVKDDASINKIESQGRALLKDLSSLLMTFVEGPNKPVNPIMNKRMRTTDSIYMVVSPTEVKMIPKNPEASKGWPTDQSMKFEDGAWRYDIGGVKSIMKMLTNKANGFPAAVGSGAGVNK